MPDNDLEPRIDEAIREFLKRVQISGTGTVTPPEGGDNG